MFSSRHVLPPICWGVALFSMHIKVLSHFSKVKYPSGYRNNKYFSRCEVAQVAISTNQIFCFIHVLQTHCTGVKLHEWTCMDPVCNTLNVCKFCRNRAFIVLRASHFHYNPEQDVHIVVLIILAWVWDLY